MSSLEQQTFAAPPIAPPPEQQSVVLHQHAGRAARQASAVVVFVHGWGGDRYGTWARFPHLLFQTFPTVDVAMHAYLSGWRRLRWWLSGRFESQAQVLAGVLWDDLKDYPRIIIIAHSQGGLLAKEAICQLIQRDDRNTLERLAGLFLMAAGQGGTHWFTFLPDWLSTDVASLKPGSVVQQRTWRCFADRVEDEPRPRPDGVTRFVIPRWAIQADADKVVSSLSSELGMASDRIKTVPGTHFSIVKPSTADHPGYRAVASRITGLLANPITAPGQGEPVPDSLVPSPAASQQRDTRKRPSPEPEQKDSWIMLPTDFFWNHADADALFRRLVTAYGPNRLERVRVLAARALIDVHGFWNDRLSASEVWTLTLEAGQAQGRLQRLIERVLEDGSVAAHHAEIRRLSVGLRDGGH